MNNLANTGDDLTGLIDDIRRITDNDDLIIVWNAMKNQWDRNARAKVQSFNELDLVEVTFKDGVYRCRVTKVNQKTLGVTILEGPWKGRKASKISPRYVTKVTQEQLNAEREYQI